MSLFSRSRKVVDAQAQDETSLGAILVRQGCASFVEITLALDRQASEVAHGRPKRPLGVMLIEMGAVTAPEVAAALNAQKRLKKGDHAGGLLAMARAKLERMAPAAAAK